MTKSYFKIIASILVWLFLFLNITFGKTYWQNFVNIPYEQVLTKEWQTKYFNYSKKNINRNRWQYVNTNKVKSNKFNVQYKTILIWLDNLMDKNITMYEYITKDIQRYWQIRQHANQLFEYDWKNFRYYLNNPDETYSLCKKYLKPIKKLVNTTYPVVSDYRMFNIALSRQQFEEIIWCYMLKNQDTLSVNWEINTVRWYERETNIWIWIKTIEWLFKYWEILSVYDHTNQWKWYADWYALVFKEWKWTEEKVSWWWLCWVSTVLYQTVLNSYYDFNIVERHPHSSFFITYYNYYWVDATITWEWKYAYKDFKLENKHWSIIILPYTNVKYNDYWKKTWFQYWIKLWSLTPFKKTYFTNWIRNWKTITNEVYDSKTNKLITTIDSYYANEIH